MILRCLLGESRAPRQSYSHWAHRLSEDTSMTTADDDSNEAPFLDTIEGEITFFRSVMRARPVGIHRHFHVLAICNAIHRETGHWVPAEEIWGKLRNCYDLDILESIVCLFSDLILLILSFAVRRLMGTRLLATKVHLRSQYVPHLQQRTSPYIHIFDQSSVYLTTKCWSPSSQVDA